jgi:hypothetical protein
MIALMHRIFFGRKLTESSTGTFATYITTDTGHTLSDGSNSIII